MTTRVNFISLRFHTHTMSPMQKLVCLVHSTGRKPRLVDRTDVIIVVKPRTQTDAYSSGTITNSRYPWTSEQTLQLSERQQVTGSLIYIVKNSRLTTTKH